MALGLVVAALLAVPGLGYREGPLPDRVGACGFGPTCREAGCHAEFLIGSSTLTWSLAREPAAPLPTAYVPESVYSLRLDVRDTDPAASVWGFELAPIASWISCAPPLGGGDVQPVDPARVRRIEDQGIPYLTHSCLCPSEVASCCGYVPETAPGEIGWSFTWTAPPRGSGDVTFAMAFNAANWDGTPTGDRISLAETTIPEEACPPRVADLAVRLAACEPGAPGERRVELSWTAGGTAAFVRATTDRGLLPAGAASWTLAPSACLPIDGAPVTYFSVADDCALGSEGPH